MNKIVAYILFGHFLLYVISFSEFYPLITDALKVVSIEMSRENI